MTEADEKIEIDEASTRPGLVRRYLTGTTSLVGSVSSMINTVRVGADAIGNGMQAVTASVSEVTSNARVETFDQALQRLGISDSDLPRIHNQILVQLYGAFSVAVIAALATVFFISSGGRGVLVPLVCAATGLSALAMWAQSSLQALQIRSRKLGLFGEWVSTPSQWFASRLVFEVPVAAGDSRLDPGTARRLATSSRRHFLTAAGFVVASAIGVAATPAGMIPGSALLAGLVAALSFGRAIMLSGLVMQSAEGRECDLLYWLGRPGRWIP
jgi:hypothetical protein